MSLAAANPLSWLEQIVLESTNLLNNARKSIDYGVNKDLYNLITAAKNKIDGAAKKVSHEPFVEAVSNRVHHLEHDGAVIGKKVLNDAKNVAHDVASGAHVLANKVSHVPFVEAVSNRVHHLEGDAANVAHKVASKAEGLAADARKDFEKYF